MSSGYELRLYRVDCERGSFVTMGHYTAEAEEAVLEAIPFWKRGYPKSTTPVENNIAEVK